MGNLWERAKVLAGTFVTYVVVANAAITGALVGLEPYRDTPWVGDAIQKGGVVLAALASVVVIVRNVVQIHDPALKGLLLPTEQDFYEAVDDYPEDWEGDTPT
jgi:hypothetical protein